MNKKYPFIIMGLTGLSMTLALHVSIEYMLGVGGEAWWLVWGLFYLVWLIFLVIGWYRAFQHGHE